MPWFRKKQSEEDKKADELLRSILGDDWEQTAGEEGSIPTKDVLGRPFDEMTDSQIEAEVDASLTAKRNRKSEIEDELENFSPTDEDRSELEDELYQIESFLWLARGGDRRGEPPPERKRAE